MFATIDKLKVKFEGFILFFILLQPIIDLLTTFSISILKINLTVGVFVRLFVMMLGIAYILWANRLNGKKTIIYVVILSFFFFFNLLSNFFVKDPISLGAEIKLISKVMYPLVMLFVFITIFKDSENKEKLYNRIVKFIQYSMVIIGFVMLISTITGTGIKSYESIKLGWQGWFFAGNELGAILSICFPLMVLFAIKKTDNWNKWYYWLPVLLTVFSLLVLGTKVGFLAPLLVLIIGLVMTLIDSFKRKKKSGENKFIVPSFIGVIIILFTLSIPFTPVVFNTNTHLSWVGINQPEKEKAPEENKEKAEEKKEIERKQVENLLLSGREQFLNQHRVYFENAPLNQKILGMGYGGNYNTEAKMIEMDFYDLFYSFGYLGFLLIFLPFIYLLTKIIFVFFKEIKEYFTTSNVLIGSGIILGLGIAYTAGHVFTAPAVSLYLVILFSLLAYRFKLL